MLRSDEEQRFITVSEMIAVLDSGKFTLKEVLGELTVMAQLNGWTITRRDNMVVYQYGEYGWETVTVYAIIKGLPLWNYHTNLFLIQI